MSMADLEKAIELVERNSDRADFMGEKSEELIRKAECAIGLAFPPTYREFLKRLGCGDVAGVEFYGVISVNFEDSSAPDAIWLTLEERKSSDFPSSHIIVGSTGDGAYYAIDYSLSDRDNDFPIVEYWPGLRKQKVVAEDFGQFFLESVSNALD